MSNETQSQGDPSGVNRPLAPDRVEPARENSGIMVGSTPTREKTTTGTQVDGTQTAFIKVYQDAGVIGLSMLTLLALCVMLGVFCLRLIKMYAALAEAGNKLESTRTQAVEKLATSILLIDSQIKSAMGEIRRDHDEQVDASKRIESRIELADERARASFELLTRALTGTGGVRLSPQPTDDGRTG